MRLLISFFLTIAFATIVNAQDVEYVLEPYEVMIADEQTARIVPLYEDFDLLQQLLNRDVRTGDFDRRERFIYRCAVFMFNAEDSFRFDWLGNLSIGDLIEWRDHANAMIDAEVDTLVIKALMDAANVLPGKDMQMCIVPAPPDVDGLFGLGFGGGMLLVVGDDVLQRDNFEQSLKEITVHEYHHSYRYDDPQRRQTGGNILLERIVIEGMAEYFTQLVYPTYNTGDSFPLTLEEERELWALIEPQLYSDDSDENDGIMFGQRGTYPPLAGYNIGFRIVEAFATNNPDVPVAEWSIMAGGDIYAASGYNP